MKFKVLKKVNIKNPVGEFITVKANETVDLPVCYKIHPDLELVKEVKEEVKEIKLPAGLDKNNDGIVTDKEVAQHLGAKGGRKSKGRRNK